jgi:hypothetical protein
MSFKIIVSVIALATSGAAFAQTEAPATPDPVQAAVQTTAMAFGQCVVSGMQGVAATVAAQAAAAQVLGGCATQKQQLVQSVEALIATMPEAERAGATAQLHTRLAGAEAEIAAEIERRRAAPAAPAPAAAATPQR